MEIIVRNALIDVSPNESIIDGYNDLSTKRRVYREIMKVINTAGFNKFQKVERISKISISVPSWCNPHSKECALRIMSEFEIAKTIEEKLLSDHQLLKEMVHNKIVNFLISDAEYEVKK